MYGDDDLTTIKGRVMAMVKTRLHEEAIANQIADVVQGMSVTRSYEVRGDRKVLVKETVRTKPEDQARGLLFLQKIPGLNMGLTEKGLKELSTTDAIKQFAPTVNPEGILWEDGDEAQETREALEVGVDYSDAAAPGLPSEAAVPSGEDPLEVATGVSTSES